MNKVYSFLGLAQKAGKLASGEETCERAVKSGKIYLVIIAEDASDNTKKKFSDICSYNDVKIKFFGEKEIIGKYIGKEIRAVVGVSDQGFADRLSELIGNVNVVEIEHGGAQFGKS